MKTFLHFAFACLLAKVAVSFALADSVPQVEWQRSYGGTNTDFLFGLAQATDGGYFLVGNSYGPASGIKTSTNYGDYDGWVVKIDGNGNIIWEADFGGTNTDQISAVQQTADGGCVVAGLTFSGISGNRTNNWNGSSDAWVMKLDANGNRQWEKCYGGTSIDSFNYIQTNSEGGYFVCGTSMSGISGNKTTASFGFTDSWVYKLDANGNKAWEKAFGGTGGEGALCVDATRDGGCVIGGPSSSGVNGNKTSPNYGGNDYWIIKLDTDGNKQWENSFGGTSSDTLVKLLQTPDDGYILGGYSSSGISGNKTSPNYGGSDFWVIKLDSGGNKIWEASLGGNTNEELRGLTLTSDGGYLLGGYSASSVSGNKTTQNFGGADFWLVKLDTSGNKVWDQTFGGTNDDFLYALRPTADNGFILGGYSLSPPSGNKTSPSYGGNDFWVIKLTTKPRLSATLSGQQILISWPSTFTGYVLEQNLNLGSANWSGVGTSPTDDGTNWTVALDRQSKAGFFRLRAQ